MWACGPVRRWKRGCRGGEGYDELSGVTTCRITAGKITSAKSTTDSLFAATKRHERQESCQVSLSKFERVKVATMRSRSFVSKSPCTRRPRDGVGFDAEIVDEWGGMIVMRIAGPNAAELFASEAGGHRWQRVPPNERKDKVHSSTVTVAVFPEVRTSGPVVRESDCEITTCRGSGPGGQKRNKTDSAVQIKHRPTGTIVRCETERSQGQNKATAMALLTARICAAELAKCLANVRQLRQEQIGSGERSDKIRTVQMQNGQVVNHLTGKKAPVEKYLKGDIWCVA